MSTDYSLACDGCRKTTHLATRFVGGPTFGLSAGDDGNRRAALEFIIEHTGHGVRVVCDSTDDPAMNYQDGTIYSDGIERE